MTHKYENVDDENYFRKVLGNMRKLANPEGSHQKSRVQFGETGKGVTPHYMIVDASDKKRIFDGKNHGAFTASSTEQFSESNLSPSFTFEQVQQEIEKRRSPSKKRLLSRSTSSRVV